MSAAQVALLVATLLLFGSKRGWCGCTNMTSFSSQLDILLAEYDREVAPEGQVLVETALDLRHAAVYERSATVRLLADLHLNWNDKRIIWNATDWGCDSALVDASRLWVPDVGVLSVATLGTEGDTSLRARLSSDGHIYWILRLDIIAPLTLQLTDWPQDQQEVAFKFGSRSHSSDEMLLTLSDLQHATVFESGTWELIRVRGAEMELNNGDFQRRVVKWMLVLRRRAAAHTLAVGAVFAGSVLLLVAATMLPPNTRPPLCAASAAIASLWLISALVRIPAGASTPRAMSLLSATCICGAIAAASAAVVLRVSRCVTPPPNILRTLVTTASTFITLTPPEGGVAECSAWAAAARLLDLLIQALLIFTLFVLLCVYI
ncbi:neuronal acetylcholine receptor subunit beta-3-like [Pieris napi]|uniref:neuronal acetylcholine receptor subunit beta-3-like n=1 Tax=Pieris napi TaxID=78633 RepID=UPI001FB96570|nr:neuronal acetylcholine receptor subunit beta-3-like [Pieris napi]